MDWDLYRRIIDECVSYRMWRISPYLMNEPLLDPKIGKRIGYISERKRFPTYTKINTNASLLSEEAANQILESGLDILTCSVHGIVKEKYDRTMVGLQLEEVLANVDRFLDMKARMKKKRPELRVTMIRTKLIEPDIQHIKGYWKARGVKVNIRPMTNRADKRISALKISSSPLTPFDWCVRIMRQAYVNVRGQVLLCCNDWEQTTVLGDLTKQSLQEVWNGEVFQAVRRRFLQRDWKGLPCAACLMPKEHGGW
jgi:MoaA/NifB/PqqE/SkfB family radical SAM enzyme